MVELRIYEESGTGKSLETGSRLVDAQGCWKSELGIGEGLLMKMKFLGPEK